MTKVQRALLRYVAPFLAGVCMAAATVVSTPASVVAFVYIAGVLVFLSLPAGARMIARGPGAEV
jgi:hypothetical protein